MLTRKILGHDPAHPIVAERAKYIYDHTPREELVAKYGVDRLDNTMASVVVLTMPLQSQFDPSVYDELRTFTPPDDRYSYQIVTGMSIVAAKELCRQLTLDNMGNLLALIHCFGTTTTDDVTKLVDAMASIYAVYNPIGPDVTFKWQTLTATESAYLHSIRRWCVRIEALHRAPENQGGWFESGSLTMDDVEIQHLTDIRASYQDAIDTLGEVFDGEVGLCPTR